MGLSPPNLPPLHDWYDPVQCGENSSLDRMSFMQSIPQSFSAAGHFPPSKMRVVLRNSAEKAWDVSCIYHARRHYFSRGWAPFACYIQSQAR
ncbi:hypothetical protein CK203_020677 [Vitis vinifera]|uniref:TF-B3 domain-containing protein n=1 Tax=Vitis vinifera TaxID=29760 RepID=A0A438FN00_VITVI|nr:hypothetical protein CK203_020677 [Vitis vinifera]